MQKNNNRHSKRQQKNKREPRPSPVSSLDAVPEGGLLIVRGAGGVEVEKKEKEKNKKSRTAAASHSSLIHFLHFQPAGTVFPLLPRLDVLSPPADCGLEMTLYALE